ncbi:cell adhesion domain-containing protein [Candidatus Magnetomorum sp. HK-1]|nr:cell adhesion domain-containing protein [Candidatus Magnetomorum sp. HK-1]
MKKVCFIILIVLLISNMGYSYAFALKKYSQPKSEVKNTISISYTSNISDGAVDITVNTPVKIVFDEDINDTTITTDTFFLSNSSGVKIPGRIVTEGRMIILFPQRRLKPAATYKVTLDAIYTNEGNPIDKISITFTNKDLDFGLYWFGYNGLHEKYFPEYDNAYYKPEKATLVFAHGWQANFVNQTDEYGNPTFNYETFLWKEDNFGGASKHNGFFEYINHPWLDKGYNTGIVYWTQFADEPTFLNEGVIGVSEAEAKIWSFDGPQGSRYRLPGDNQYKVWDKKFIFDGIEVDVESATEAMGIYLVHALKANTSGNIRFGGHSLGNQVICNLAKMCYENGIVLKRIALLDPSYTIVDSLVDDIFKKYKGDFYSYMPDDEYGTTPAERCRKILFNLMNKWTYINDFVVEAYHTTGLNLSIPVMDSNSSLMKEICNVNLAPWYYSANQIPQKHLAAKNNYFLSMGFDSPIECEINWLNQRIKTGNIGPSATTPNSRIKEMMGGKYDWTQVEGRYTPTPVDDWFERKKSPQGEFDFDNCGLKGDINDDGIIGLEEAINALQAISSRNY